jgi:hypothetical protein
MSRGLLDPEALIGQVTDLEGVAEALAPAAPRTPGRTVVVPEPRKNHPKPKGPRP